MTKQMQTCVEKQIFYIDYALNYEAENVAIIQYNTQEQLSNSTIVHPTAVLKNVQFCSLFQSPKLSHCFQLQ